MTERLVLGLTRGPGAAIGLRLLELLRKAQVETHLVLGPSADRSVLEQTGLDSASVGRLADRLYQLDNQAARISSSSFLTKGMVIVPCDMQSLEAIATGMATNLLYRAADVTMKEGRKLLLILTEPATEPRHDTCIRRISAVPGVILSPPSFAPLAVDPDLIELTTKAILHEFKVHVRS